LDTRPPGHLVVNGGSQFAPIKVFAFTNQRRTLTHAAAATTKAGQREHDARRFDRTPQSRRMAA
jgi:hypothetical protein